MGRGCLWTVNFIQARGLNHPWFYSQRHYSGPAVPHWSETVKPKSCASAFHKVTAVVFLCNKTEDRAGKNWGMAYLWSCTSFSEDISDFSSSFLCDHYKNVLFILQGDLSFLFTFYCPLVLPLQSASDEMVAHELKRVLAGGTCANQKGMNGPLGLTLGWV